MSEPRALPCGTWPSPLTAAMAAAGGVTLGFVGASGASLLWVEGRPAEKGRSVLVSSVPGGTPADIVDAGANVRTRVHEYGGTPWVAVGDRLVFSMFADQRLHVRDASGRFDVLTPAGCRYADGQGAPDGRSLVIVREDHRAGGEPVNSVVMLDLVGPADGGRDRRDGAARPRLPCRAAPARPRWCRRRGTCR